MDINIYLIFWGILVGVVFSVIGAAGGILASFGLITLVGETDPNTVKPMAQIMTLAMVSVFLPAYIKRACCVVFLGLLLATGSVIGAWLGSTFSSHYLSDMDIFRPLFGFLALLIATQVIWKTWVEFKKQDTRITSKSNPPEGVNTIQLSHGRLTFIYTGQRFDIHIAYPILAGFLIAMVAAIFGVGGGFLLVPFMVSMLGMPMHIVPATAAIPIFIGGSVSITNYLKLGAQPDYNTLILLAIGGMVGALLGPKLNSLSNEYWLKMALGVIVFSIGLKYII